MYDNKSGCEEDAAGTAGAINTFVARHSTPPGELQRRGAARSIDFWFAKVVQRHFMPPKIQNGSHDHSQIAPISANVVNAIFSGRFRAPEWTQCVARKT